jgi:signal transduction protein with GAF and PtsI domain
MSADRILYGVAMRQAVASGDVEQMKSVAKEAEDHLAEHGNVSAALEALKVEIEKAESGGGS